MGKTKIKIGIKKYFFDSFLYAQGDCIFQQWKKRFFALIYHHQYLLCNYAVNGTSPKKILSLDGYTVDYSEPTSRTQGIILDALYYLLLYKYILYSVQFVFGSYYILYYLAIDDLTRAQWA